ncbi:MAG: hypothetical protein GY795_33140 [Desulfobacterales bacterium]|nr:hypothetical protein [Desulfobacterales bacterium]
MSRDTVSDFFSLLHKYRARYVLVGGIAMLQYVEGRNTEDIDIIISVPDLNRLPGIEIIRQDKDFAQGKFQGLRTDFLLTGNPLFQQVLSDYTVQQFGELNIPSANVEGLALLKLYALPSLYRHGNFARAGLYENDIATLSYYYKLELLGLISKLSGHLLESDIKELKIIASEIEGRKKRFQGCKPEVLEISNNK